MTYRVHTDTEDNPFSGGLCSPCGLPEFSAIREEINKASHPSQPELNWKLVESLALAIFKANGVDLHTATYYT
ncbi:type VI secretion system ImpA family N-terminal domain-containing protein, partial [Escherichia marmotae]|nr:type VI secretion system ImpA family N-terminal domain-containing protein [Escherichia marmotae]